MSKAALRRARLTRDHELKIIGQMFDLLALLPPDRRKWTLEYLEYRLPKMPVIAEIENPEEEQPPLAFVRSSVADGTT